MVDGQAAKLVRRARLRERGDLEDFDIDLAAAAVGLPGQPFHLRFGTKVSLAAMTALPTDLTLIVTWGSEEAHDVLLTYHALMCRGEPDTKDGKEHALHCMGWKAPQQRNATDGRPAGRDERATNLVVAVLRTCPTSGAEHMVGCLALAQGADLRKCSVHLIHVVPQLRGPLQLPFRMWERAKSAIHAHVANGPSRSRVRSVRFTLALASCQSQQGAHFWIHRMGWSGTADAVKAANAWGQGERWKVGTYELSYIMQV